MFTQASSLHFPYAFRRSPFSVTPSFLARL
jgi:hypothetical protein